MSSLNPSRNKPSPLARVRHFAGWVIEQFIRFLAAPFLSIWTRVAFVWAGLVLPVICFSLAWSFEFSDDWQSAELHALTGYLLWRAAWPFYPFVAFAAISLTAIVVRHDLRRHAALRFGVYSGVLLSTQFVLLEYATIIETSALFGPWIMPLGILVGFSMVTGCSVWVVPRLLFACERLFYWCRNGVSRMLHHRRIGCLRWLAIRLRRYCGKRFYRISIALLVIAILGISWPITFIFSLSAAPVWSLMVFSIMTVRLLREEAVAWRFRLLQLMALVAYLSAWLAAWRAAARIAFKEYSELPIEAPPQCYVATAAASGHARFVGRDHRFANMQLRRLKAFEVVLRAIWPAANGELRRLYDRFGPALAARIESPWMADLAYLALKPAEWLAHGLLIAVAVKSSDVERLYQDAVGAAGSGFSNSAVPTDALKISGKPRS